MKLLNFDSFVNESLKEKMKNDQFIDDIRDSDFTTIKTSLRHAKKIGERFNDSYGKSGKQTSSNVFVFNNNYSLADFVDDIINVMNIPTDEFELS